MAEATSIFGVFSVAGTITGAGFSATTRGFSLGAFAGALAFAFGAGLLQTHGFSPQSMHSSAIWRRYGIMHLARSAAHSGQPRATCTRTPGGAGGSAQPSGRRGSLARPSSEVA